MKKAHANSTSKQAWYPPDNGQSHWGLSGDQGEPEWDCMVHKTEESEEDIIVNRTSGHGAMVL